MKKSYKTKIRNLNKEQYLSFEELSKKVNDGIALWFLPHIKIIKVNVK